MSQPLRRAVLALMFTALLPVVSHAGLLDKLEWKTEKHFGKATKEQLREEYGFVENPLLNDFIGSLGANLAAMSHRTDIPYEFHVIDSSEVNAFAAPGGFIFVTRGLLQEVDSDDELAAIMGHEVSHVAAHHGAKNIKKLPFLIAGLSILNSKAGDTTARIGGMVLSLAQMHYSRVDEYQADELGVSYTYKTGYDPHAMTTFFEKLEKQYHTGNLTRLDVSLMSHPKTTSRMMKIAGYPEMSMTQAGPLVRIGDAYRERFYFHNASEKYKLALAADPENINALNGMAQCALELGDYGVAREFFDRTLAREAENQAAINGLARIEQVLAGVPAHSEPAAADPDQAREAYDALALAVMHIEDHIQALHADRSQVSEQSGFMDQQFTRDVEEFSNTANNISEYDEERVAVLYGASEVFSGLFNELAELERMSEDVVLVAENGLKRGRIALFRMDRGPVTPDMVAAARQLAGALGNYEKNLTGIHQNIADSLETSSILYQESDRAMDELRDTLQSEDTGTITMRSTAITDRLTLARDRLTEMQSLTDRARQQVDATETAMRQASLNLNTLTLDANQDRIYKGMFARRFRLDPATLDRLLALGYGYGDTALIQSRARQRGDDLAAILNEADGSKTVDKLLDFPATDSNTGEDILLSFAEMDLSHVMQDVPSVRMDPATDAHALAHLTTPADETLDSDPDLKAAYDLIVAGDPQAAVEMLHKRGQAKPASALSHKLLGLAYKHAGDYEEAKEEFKNASKHFAGDPQAHFLWANTFQELERYNDALNEYRTTLEMDPDYGPAHLGKAYALAMLGENMEAETAYREAIRLNADPAAAHRNLGLLLYSQGRYYEALAEFEASLQSAPDQPGLQEIAAHLRG